MSAATRPEANSRADRASGCGGALSSDLGWALGVVFRSYLKAANAALADVPGGPRGYQVLAAAIRGEPENQVALALHLGVDRTVMTYLLDDLEGAGLIERRPDPADRRARHIGATAAGRDLLDDLDQRLRAAEHHVLAGLDKDDDQGAFRALLRQLATHANALDPVRGTCDVPWQDSTAVTPVDQGQRVQDVAGGKHKVDTSKHSPGTG
jgi:DNA-binding MarR family transcriptional regulator